jgi:hypothetical protein
MINEVVVFPDAVAVAITELRARLPHYGYPAVPVTNRVPDPRPSTFVTVDRGGGVASNIVTDVATLLFEVWGAPGGDSPYTLAQVCRGIMHALLGRVVAGVTIYKIDEFAGPGALPDQSAQPRVVFTLAVSMRGHAVSPT